MVFASGSSRGMALSALARARPRRVPLIPAQALSRRNFGLLKVGDPLQWPDAVSHLKYVREHGLLQFLATYRRLKGLAKDRLFYGDEIEHAILKLDKENRTVKISLRSSELLDTLRERESRAIGLDGCTWHQEYGSWMLEGTPAMPYGAYTSSLLQMEYNMRLRRARLHSALAEDEIAPTMVNFPLMGVGEFTSPPAPAGGPTSHSVSVPDTVINPHPRFGALTSNIRQRRGSKVDIRVPLFQDSATSPDEGPDIEMDCMAYGMGCCCLQVTFQASDVDESRILYDQLAPLTPILLALTAATPIFRGRLSAIDARWSVVSASVDDRTPAERGEATDAEPHPDLAGGGVQRLSKSRYDSISTYMHPSSAAFNDLACEVDAKFESMLISKGVDGPLAHHLAHLFVRDPLVLFDGSIQEVNDEESTEHFDSINSTNWNTVRWKPPPLQEANRPHVGWRTEFRSMEVQLTDFENAAFSAFVVLLTRVLLVFDLDFIVPLSKVDVNMKRAHLMDAVNNQKFWFRKHLLPSRKQLDSSEEMTMEEIITGKDRDFPGLVPLCFAYLEHIQCDAHSLDRISEYLHFIERRAKGEVMTPATWMRNFVLTHPEYKQDSIVSEGIAYDLVKACDEIGRGVRKCPEILGDIDIEPLPQDSIYSTALKSESTQDARAALLRQLAARASSIDGALSLPSTPRRQRP